MRIKILTVCSLAALALATGPSWAQHGGGAPAGQRGDVMMDQTRDRDRLDTPDQDRDRDRDQDKLGDKDQDRDRDRIHASQLAEQELGAWALLTDGEAAAFHRQMQQAKSAEERARIRVEHRTMVQERARELGVDGSFGPGDGSGAARQRYIMAQLLTEQERLRFHEQMRNASSEQERARIRSEHQALIQDRARERGVELPMGFGQAGR